MPVPLKTLPASVLETLDVFTMTDQPETCSRCGCRTDFEELSAGRQVHQCLNTACEYVWICEEGEVNA